MIRGWWEWVTETRDRLVGMLGLVAAIVLFGYAYGPGIVQQAVDNAHSASHTTPPQASPSQGPTPHPASSPASSTVAPPPPVVNAREAATEAARAYVVAFFAKAGDDARWHATIDSHSTQTLADLNSTVPRADVPAARLLSLRVTGIKPTYAELSARMSNGMTLFIATVLDADEWRVNEVAPEDGP